MKVTEQYIATPKRKNTFNTEADYMGDVVICLFFSDGHHKRVDFQPFLKRARHPVIKKYLDETLFKTYQLKDGNLDWNDFDLCFPLENLYLNRLLKNEKATINIAVWSVPKGH